MFCNPVRTWPGQNSGSEPYCARKPRTNRSRPNPMHARGISSLLDPDLECAAKEVRVIIQRAYSQPLVVRQQHGHFVFRFRCELEIGLGSDCYRPIHAACCLFRRCSTSSALARGVPAAIKSWSGMLMPNSCSSVKTSSNSRTDEKPLRKSPYQEALHRCRQPAR